MTHTDNQIKKILILKNKNIMTASLPCSFNLTPLPPTPQHIILNKAQIYTNNKNLASYFLYLCTQNSCSVNIDTMFF